MASHPTCAVPIAYLRVKTHLNTKSPEIGNTFSFSIAVRCEYAANRARIAASAACATEPSVDPTQTRGENFLTASYYLRY